MRRASVLATGLLAVLAAAFLPVGSSGTDEKAPPQWQLDRELYKEVREIASMLRAPCCPNLTLSQHNSPIAMKMKEEIAQMVREGRGRAAIIAQLKEEYGDVIAPSVIPALWKPYLLVGGPIVGLGLLALLGRWILTHEKSPTVLHVEGSEGSDAGPGVRAA